MKVYTKTGDKGETSLFGGKRLPKYHLRIDAYGTCDELNSWIGLLRDQQTDISHKTLLKEIQDRLFTVGAILASDPDKQKLKKPDLHATDVDLLEKEIDRMDETLPPMRHFVLPGGHTTVSYCHLARCVCRRAERLVVQLHAEEPINGLVITYLNRLSDYLFVLSRKLAAELGAEEYPWIPRM
ncbi:MAG: cob(I)yrinic acid a,c-diamide adenosyltransferase [Flavobacteriales bacterium]